VQLQSTRGFVRTLEECKKKTQVLYNRTQHSGQVFYSFIKYLRSVIKSLRSFARAVGSYKERATVNQIARNMSVI
jgi:hypothetical protein